MSRILKHIEDKAEALLNSYLVRSVPIPIENIAKRCNVKIRRSASKEFSGLLIRKRGESLMGVNSEEALVRQRFTIAHELGHLFLHHGKNAFVDYIEHRRPGKKIKKVKKETEADMYAAALLMPKSRLEKDFNKIAKNGFSPKKLKLLAKKYKVSEAAMNFRLVNLKLSR